MGPATCTGPGAVSMKVEYVQGAPFHSKTQLHMQVLHRAFMQRQARTALYNRLFALSIVTRYHGVGGILLPWGKGLICSVLLIRLSHGHDPG